MGADNQDDADKYNKETKPTITAIGGQLVRTVHAQGGRDASFYMPTFVMYYAGGYPNNNVKGGLIPALNKTEFAA